MNKSEPNPMKDFLPEDVKLIQAIQEMQKAQAELLKAVRESNRLMQQVVEALGKAQKQTQETLLAVVRVIPGKHEALELSQAIKAVRAAKHPEEEAAARKRLEEKRAIYKRRNPRDAWEPAAARTGEESPSVHQPAAQPVAAAEEESASDTAKQIAASGPSQEEGLSSYIEAVPVSAPTPRERTAPLAAPDSLRVMLNRVEVLLEDCSQRWTPGVDTLGRLARRLEKHQFEAIHAEPGERPEQANERLESLADALLPDLEAINGLLSELPSEKEAGDRSLLLADVRRRLGALRDLIWDFIKQHGPYDLYPIKVGDPPPPPDHCEIAGDTLPSRSARPLIGQIICPGYRKQRGDNWDTVVKPRIRLR